MQPVLAPVITLRVSRQPIYRFCVALVFLIAAQLSAAKAGVIFGNWFGIHDWLNYLQDQAAKYRKLVERADDPFVKNELLALASVCDEIADNIEDHLTGGEDPAPRGPSSRLS
jgi:hypothetical protein